jgi:D-alanyl-lipoteichoic acid acyltransferase DltB (MBOAT superfamily)
MRRGAKRRTEALILGTASLKFLGYAFAVILVFNSRGSVAWRQFVLLAASITFVAFFSPHLSTLAPLGAFLIFGLVSLRLMQAGFRQLLVPALLIGVGGYVWLKKYAFIPSSLFLEHPYLTVGLSYILFRVLHLIIDAQSHYSTLPAKISLVSYLNYTLNFTTLIAGPIQRYNEYAAMQLAPTPLPLNVVVCGEAFERIVVGFFKVNVLSLLLSLIQAEALNAFPSTHSGARQVLTGVIAASAYPFYLYCNFSGYIDIVIGIARFLRMKLPENFDRPFSSENYLVFWSRWHITLSSWLYMYVYGPLMIRLIRRWPRASVEPLLLVFAYFVTFFLVGVWHGQTSMFVLFGVLLGLGVSATKLYQLLMAKSIGRQRYEEIKSLRCYQSAGRGVTFTWSTFTLLWFWSSWTQLRFLARSLGPGEIVLVWLSIFVAASLVLAAWEGARERLLLLEFGGCTVVSSRYFRTVWGTALAVIALATVLLFNGPAPDIVYKTF